MSKYTWQDVDQLEDAIASSRLSAEILAALPEVAPFALSARKDAILAELIAAVLGEGGGGLTKRVEYFVRVNGQNNLDNILIAEMTGYTRQGGLNDTVIRWRAELSSRSTLQFTDVDDRRSILLKPGTPNDAANSVHTHFMVNPLGGTEGVRQFVDFRETFGAVAGTLLDQAQFKPPAWSIAAWVRKETSGDTTHARVGFGFGDEALVFASALVSRIGMFGDGVSGFRFGSLNCPDGLGAGDNASTDIDTGAEQPAEMVSPGTNWFHVRIKMVPPTPEQSGRWGAYLNGVLKKTFTTQANFPRGSQATDRNYRLIQPALFAFADASQIPGILLHDLRITVEDDWSL